MTTRFGKNPSSNWRDKSDLRTFLTVYTINLRSLASESAIYFQHHPFATSVKLVQCNSIGNGGIHHRNKMRAVKMLEALSLLSTLFLLLQKLNAYHGNKMNKFGKEINSKSWTRDIRMINEVGCECMSTALLALASKTSCRTCCYVRSGAQCIERMFYLLERPLHQCTLTAAPPTEHLRA